MEDKANAKAIYWRPGKPAVLIGGRILDYWAVQGYEKSVYGYPAFYRMMPIKTWSLLIWPPILSLQKTIR
ncbi:LGFP repeat-containing protein [Niabella sp. CJ426]|uniref:LGFP repeat-containing protein n=1 Tax=Niabella sp. CJ426 TaxID=3393740 RepID=UPI003D02DF49